MFKYNKLFLIGLVSILSLFASVFAVDISGCSVLNIPGETYYLINDIINSTISNCIDISANNVTLDCQGHLIDGDDLADNGIILYRSTAQDTNVEIRNCIVSDWDTANIYLYRARRNVLIDINSTSSPDYGVNVYDADYLNLSNVNLSFNYYGFYGASLDYSVFDNLFASFNSQAGIYLNNAYYNNFNDANLSFNYYGVNLYNGYYNNFANVNSNNNSNGFYLSYSDRNNFTYINLSNNNYGFSLSSGSDYNFIINSSIVNQKYDGIYIYSSNSNIFNSNEVGYNNNWDIYVSGLNNNFYNNYLFSSLKISDVSSSLWNNSQGGNYWKVYDSDFEDVLIRI